jgi:hypothetical protein
MASDGKQLEALVAWVEQTMTPHGLTVLMNERVFDDQGIQVAEFDVEISGKFGSTEIRWLIECRDRPGQGPAPGSWIEQLVGRRTRFGFNKVTAVSTTGFAPGAVDFARSQQIELREVASLSPDAFVSWCSMRTIGQLHSTATLEHATINLDESEPHDKKQALESMFTNAPLDAVLLRSVKTGDCGTLAQAFLSAVQAAGNLFDDVLANGAAKRISLNVDYPSDDDHFVIETVAGTVRVRSIAFVGDLRRTSTEVQLLGVTQYRQLDSAAPISEVVSFGPLEILGNRSSLELHRIEETGGIHLRLQHPATKRV